MPSGAAGASSGEITRAEASSDWTAASIAGVVERINQCQTPSSGKPGPFEPAPPTPPDSEPWTCGWIPYVTLGPGSSQGDCTSSARHWDSQGESVQLLWTGQERFAAGKTDFDLQGLALERGADARLLCLAAVESVLVMRFCIPEISCPPAIVHVVHQLDSALLEVAKTPQSEPPALAQDPPPPSSPACRAQRRKNKRLKNGAKIGLGSYRKATEPGRPIRRCKTG